MPHRLTREEQETIITRTADQSGWVVYTCDPVVKRRLKRIATAIGVSPTIVDRYGVEYLLPLSCVRFTTPVVVSAQEKAKQVERGKRLAAARAMRASTRSRVREGEGYERTLHHVRD